MPRAQSHAHARQHATWVPFVALWGQVSFCTLRVVPVDCTLGCVALYCFIRPAHLFCIRACKLQHLVCRVVCGGLVTLEDMRHEQHSSMATLLIRQQIHNWCALCPPPQTTQKAGCHSRSLKHGRKRKLLIDGFRFVASPPEPLRVSEFQTHRHRRTRLDEARAPSCLDLANRKQKSPPEPPDFFCFCEPDL